MWGAIGGNGLFILNPAYDCIDEYSSDSLAVVVIKGRYGLIDNNGNMVTKELYDHIEYAEYGYRMKSEDLYGTISRQGTVLMSPQFEVMESLDRHRGLEHVCTKGKYGFISRTGEISVAPFSDKVENFSENFTLVTIKNKVGFVSLQGEWLSVPMFDTGGSFSGGYAFLSQAGKYGYIDKSGEFAIPMEYSSATDFNKSLGLACVAKNGLWGVIDMKGKVIVPFEYSKVELCADGCVCVEKDGKCGLFTNTGNEILPVIWDNIDKDENGRIFNFGVASGRINGQRARVDQFGNIVSKMLQS